MKTPERIRIISNGAIYRVQFGIKSVVEQDPRIVEEKCFFGLSTRLRLEKWSAEDWVWTTHSTYDFTGSLYSPYREIPVDFKSYAKAKDWIEKEFGKLGVRALEEVVPRKFEAVYK